MLRLPPAASLAARTVVAAVAVAVAVAASSPFAPDLARAQAPGGKAAPGAEAKIPGAIEAMPPWLKDAPFDAAQFFAMPPRAENAAPLYLEALAGFDGMIADWLPPDRRAAGEAGRARWKRWSPTIDADAKDPASVPPKQADAALAAFATPLRQLDAAQARPRCVFATGLGVDALLSHAQSARDVARLLTLQVGRSMDRDDVPAALKAIERTLRLARDLRPRGFAITSLIAIAIDQIAVDRMLPRVLASRRLKAEHCDRLLKLLADHEAQALDPFRAAIMGEYVQARVLLRTYADGLKTTAGPDGRPIDVPLDDEARVRELAGLALASDGKAPTPEALKAVSAEEKLPEDLARLRQVAPALRARLDDEVRALLAAAATFPARLAAIAQADRTHPRSEVAFFEASRADRRAIAQMAGRDAADLGAARCLVALRRWQLTSTKPPTDLLAVCKAAKLAAVPADPFGEGPLKMAILGDEPVIYSVGPDGRDDRAQVDSEMGKKPDGDMIYRLPKRK